MGKFKKNIPYIFLFLLSFYPIMKEAIASITVMLFLSSTVILYWSNLKINYKKYGLFPLITISGFYVLILVSILYSEETISGLQRVRSSVLLLLFPFVVIYFLPKVKRATIEIFSYGFIISNLILILYFFNVLVEGLAIDRFYGLLDENLFQQALAINQYPYEFALSKAEKHLEVIYEPHKVYLSIHFLTAIFLSFNLIFSNRTKLIKKMVLGIISFVFFIGILYCQSITTVGAMVIVLLISPFIYFTIFRTKLLYFLFLVIFSSTIWASGFLHTYQNKNTTSIIMFMEHIFSSSKLEDGIDKRVYIYNCAISLIKTSPLIGFGVGDVQKELNKCYDDKNYTVAEHKSIGSDINSHNYYFNLWLSSGLLSVVLFLFFFGYAMTICIRRRQLCYFSFLLLFAISLLTENLLVRMSGVFLFGILNTLFYSYTILDVQNKK